MHGECHDWVVINTVKDSHIGAVGGAHTYIDRGEYLIPVAKR